MPKARSSSRPSSVFLAGVMQAMFMPCWRVNLSALISGYFDTTTGPKGERASYLKIAETIGRGPGDLTFYSDAPAETDAAAAAGLHVYRVDRTKPAAFDGREGQTAIVGSIKP